MSSAHRDDPHSGAATGPGEDDTEDESSLEEEPPSTISPHAPEPGTPQEPGSTEPPEEASTLEQEPVDGREDKRDVVRVRDAVDPSTVRRAPRYGRFAFLGFVLGVLVAFVVYQFPVDPRINARALLLVLVVLLGSIGIGAGYVVALLADRRSLRNRTRD